MSARTPWIALAFALLLAASIGTASAAPPEQAANGGAPVSTDLSGDQEVPPAETTATGHFEASINPGLGEICYELSWQDLTAPATAAHIHEAPAGINGGVVVPLTVTGTTGGSTTECTAVDRELAQQIASDVEAYYVNVHTSEFPGGEIRGQLSR